MLQNKKKQAENFENVLGKTADDSKELKKLPEEVQNVSQTETETSARMKEFAEETGIGPKKINRVEKTS